MDSLLRVPLQSIRHELKHTQLVIDRELQNLQQLGLGPADLRPRVAQLLARAQQVRDRVEEHERTLAARRAFVESNKSVSSDQLSLYIINYLLENEYTASARSLASELGLENMIDFELMAECREIAASIMAQQTARVLEWAVQNKTHLRKAQSPLEFDARRQHFVQLALVDRTKAVQYARKYLAKYHHTLQHTSLACATLALVSPPTEASSQANWTYLRDEFVRVFLEIHGKTPTLKLFDLVAVGLSALRTHNCSPVRPSTSRYSNQQLRDHMCPACNRDLGVLAQELPYAHHTESLLDGDMVMLPNKRCYGRSLLLDLSAKERLPRGQVYDPATLEVFDLDDLRKVFPT